MRNRSVRIVAPSQPHCVRFRIFSKTSIAASFASGCSGSRGYVLVPAWHSHFDISTFCCLYSGSSHRETVVLNHNVNVVCNTRGKPIRILINLNRGEVFQSCFPYRSCEKKLFRTCPVLCLRTTPTARINYIKYIYWSMQICFSL